MGDKHPSGSNQGLREPSKKRKRVEIKIEEEEPTFTDAELQEPLPKRVHIKEEQEEKLKITKEEEKVEPIEQKVPLGNAATANLLHKRKPERGGTGPLHNFKEIYNNNRLAEIEAEAKWDRPPFQKQFTPSKDPISFQLVEVDYEDIKNTGNRMVEKLSNGNTNDKMSVLRIYGTTEEGHSIHVRVHGYMPYFYATMPSDWVTDRIRKRDNKEDLIKQNAAKQQPAEKAVTQTDKPSAATAIDPDQMQVDEIVEPELKEGEDFVTKWNEGCDKIEEWIKSEDEAYLNLYCDGLKRCLNSLIGQSNVPYKSQVAGGNYIQKIETVVKRSLVDFSETPTRFFKITTALPSIVPLARDKLQSGVTFNQKQYFFGTFESNVLFPLRFMVDKSITGGSWITLPAGSYTPITTADKQSSCQIEVAVNYESIQVHEFADEWMKIARYRVLSFDIECEKDPGHFPDESKPSNRVIQISNTLTECDGTALKVIVKNIFSIGTVNKIDGVDVHMFPDEKSLLMAWSRFVVRTDPDFITGYNILKFDLAYLWGRSSHLRINNSFTCMSRSQNVPVIKRDATFSSKAFGTTGSFSYSMTGRVVFDAMAVFQREYKLRSYSLNAVSSNFLGEQKDDVDHEAIGPLFNGTIEERTRLAKYCIKDSELVVKLLEKTAQLMSYILMGIITGVPITLLLSKGQVVKVSSQILRFTKNVDVVVPTNKRDKEYGDFNEKGKKGKKKGKKEEKGFEGATVLSPKTGFYEDPIATLDFASLYPSIMMAHNLCYTTHVPKHMVPYIKEKYEADTDYTVTPAGHYFMKTKQRNGVLTQILEQLINARNKVKIEMALEKDKQRKELLNHRQLAIKISANSVYGFTGAGNGPLPCIPISESVTAFGRIMIEKTRDEVLKKYTVANGCEFNADVLYGDTDSVMVKFGTSDLAESMRLGKEAAAYVSSFFIKPIKLEFEKCYYPFLLSSKKRYAGLLWTKTTKYDKMDVKGLEAVRRDNCPLLSDLVKNSLGLILKERKPEKAVELCKQAISDVLQNKADVRLLVVTKGLKKFDYDGLQPHLEVHKKIVKRGGLGYSLGDRVKYVVLPGMKGTPMALRAEDPLYAIENNKQPCPDYYIDILKKPIKRILRALDPTVLAGRSITSFFPSETSAASAATAAADPLPGLSQSQSQSETKPMPAPSNSPKKVTQKTSASIFSGAHTKTKKFETPNHTRGSIIQFTVKISSCVRCKATLKAGESNPCYDCVRERDPVIDFMEANEALKKAESDYQRLWTACQTCQGSLTQPILCKADDCEIFYTRVTAKSRLEKTREHVGKFDLSW